MLLLLLPLLLLLLLLLLPLPLAHIALQSRILRTLRLLPFTPPASLPVVPFLLPPFICAAPLGMGCGPNATCLLRQLACRKPRKEGFSRNTKSDYRRKRTRNMREHARAMDLSLVDLSLVMA
jgi:hypothetical protein